MTPAAIKAAYLRALASSVGPGEQITLRRGAPPSNTDYSVHGWVTTYDPEDVVGSIQQGRRKAILLAEDVETSGFPLPILPKQDRLIWAGKTLVVSAVDDASRRVQGVLIAYELELSGA
jgi:hypothetical protein